MPEIVGSLRPPRLSTPPPSPARGEIYYDIDDDKLYWWNGATWVQSGAVSGTATVFDTDQIGTIKAFSGSTIPTNWMLADGSSLLRASYPQLFAAIGTMYGSVDATHFNLPDLRGKMIYGANSSSTQGNTGGASVHTLDLTQIPGHNHGGATGAADRSLAQYTGAADRALGTSIAGGHYHTPAAAATWFLTGSGQTAVVGTGGSSRYYATAEEGTNTAGDHSHTVTDHLHYVAGVDHLHGISTAGGGLAHNNMPPYIEIAQLIKVTGVTVDSGAALVGATGAKGDPGPWRGAWSAATAYAVGESVSYFDGLVTGTYRRKVAGTTAGTPKADTTNWEIIASGGSVGADGALAVYEQPAAPATTTVGAIWIDTDDVPPAWASLVPIATVLPTNPVDGQEVYFVADATNRILWHLRYNAGSASVYKWEYVGGPPLIVSASNSLGSAGGVAPFSSPVLTYPRAGDYLVGGSVFVTMSPNVNVALQWAALIVDGANAAAYGIEWQANYNLYATANQGFANRLMIPEMIKTGLAVNATAKLLANVAGYDYTSLHREIRATPVRIS